MTLYQPNFASHHTHDRHVGFLFTFDGIGKGNKMFHYFLFISCHIIKLQPSDKNISTHTRMNFQILPWSKSKVQAVFNVFLLTALCKRKPSDFEKLCARECLPRRANPLWCHFPGCRELEWKWIAQKQNIFFLILKKHYHFLHQLTTF